MLRRLLAGVSCLSALLLFPGLASAQTASVTSFDGTRIHVNFFPAPGLTPGRRAATVMLGPGYGSPGDTNVAGSTDLSTGAPGVGTLLGAGFNVVTWDPRGFGASGGAVESDQPRYEGRDVSAIISWLARRPQARLDRRGDPRVGMAGASYGGGIQLVAAAIDHRIDAIVPDIAWHSLISSLDKHDTSKLGWAGILARVGSAAGRLDPIIPASYRDDLLGRPLSAAERRFFAASTPDVARIRAPTLLIQGTADNLFTLQEAVDNDAILTRHGVTVKMLWFCGGHGICLTNPGDPGLITRDTLAWLERYLDRRRLRTGPAFQWVDQHGTEHAATAYPLASAGQIAGHGHGTLSVNATGGSGPVLDPPPAGELSAIAAPITPATAANALNVRLPAPKRNALVVGAPRLTVTYRGLSANHRPHTSLYGQIVDESTGTLLGNQITPIPVTLDGRRHTLSEPLEILSATDRPAQHFALQIVASTVAYQAQRSIGAVSLSRVAVTLPLVNPPQPRPATRAMRRTLWTRAGARLQRPAR